MTRKTSKSNLQFNGSSRAHGGILSTWYFILAILQSYWFPEVIIKIFLLFSVHSDWLKVNYLTQELVAGQHSVKTFDLSTKPFETSSNRTRKLRYLYYQESKQEYFRLYLEFYSNSTCGAKPSREDKQTSFLKGKLDTELLKTSH